MGPYWECSLWFPSAVLSHQINKGDFNIVEKVGIRC